MTEYLYEQHARDPTGIWEGFRPNTTMAGVSARIVYSFISKTPDAPVTEADPLFFISATFAASDFDTVAAAFSVKYGEPQSTETRTYQNSFGASFPGRIMRWDSGDANISLAEYGISRLFSYAEIANKTAMQEANRRSGKVKGDKAAKDL